VKIGLSTEFVEFQFPNYCQEFEKLEESYAGERNSSTSRALGLDAEYLQMLW